MPPPPTKIRPTTPRRTRRFFLIAGEASGDLHASHLMQALRNECAARGTEAEFRFYGGQCMEAAGGEMLCHYRQLAYMGFIPVLLHLPTIMRGMSRCKRQIEEWKPDAVILVDYPGFNLKMARHVAARGLCPVYYYISPKIWAWKEGRIKQIRKYVSHIFSILPFEEEYFHRRGYQAVTYVGNPTFDEIRSWRETHADQKEDNARAIALLPGSRIQEIKDNLSRMLRAAAPFAEAGFTLHIAVVPSIPRTVYEHLVARSGVMHEAVRLVEGRTYELLSHSAAALVTSGTATLETALLGVPQVVCYYMAFGKLMSFLRRKFLKVPFISLVNLIAGREVVPELVADDMNAEAVRTHLRTLLTDEAARAEMKAGYAEVARRLNTPGAPQRTAQGMMARLESGGQA